MRSRGAEFLAGVKAELPILLGVSPFGLIYGVVALRAGLPPLFAFAMSSVVFAGSAQFIAVQLMGAAAPAVVILATTFIVNLRHVLYGASIAPHVAHLNTRWKCGLAYLLTDEAYAVSITRFTKDASPASGGSHRHWYFLGAGLSQWAAWQVSTAVGIVVGAEVPQSWGLDFAVALTFIALVVPALTDRPSVAAALAAGAVALLSDTWPYKIGLIAAAMAGITVGLAVESRLPVKRAKR